MESSDTRFGNESALTPTPSTSHAADNSAPSSDVLSSNPSAGTATGASHADLGIRVQGVDGEVNQDNENKDCSAPPTNSSSSLSTPSLPRTDESSRRHTHAQPTTGSVAQESDAESVELDSRYDASTFTAEQALRLADNVNEKEGGLRLQQVRQDCAAKIRLSVMEQQRECTFEIPVVRNSNSQYYVMNDFICDTLIRHLEKELMFVVMRKFSFHASRIIIRWNNDHTRNLSTAELERLRDACERKRLPFSAYHAVLLEREMQERVIQSTLQQLNVVCVKKIQSCIRDHISSFLFEIPFAKYNMHNAVDRGIVYDRLIRDLIKRNFVVSEQMKSSYKFRISWLPEPEVVAVEEIIKLSSPSGPAASSTTTTTTSTVNRSGSSSSSSTSTGADSYAASSTDALFSTSGSSGKNHDSFSLFGNETDVDVGGVGNVRSSGGGATTTAQPAPAFSPVPSLVVGSGASHVMPLHWSHAPITLRSQQTLKEYTQCVGQQQNLKAQLQHVQQQIRQLHTPHHQSAPPNIQPPSSPASMLYNQHAQLLYRIQQLDTHLINLTQNILKQMSYAECAGTLGQFATGSSSGPTPAPAFGYSHAFAPNDVTLLHSPFL